MKVFNSMYPKLHLTSNGFSITAVAVALSFSSTAFAENNVLGTNAGASITTGDENVLVGESAGAAMTTGSANVVVGAESGLAVKTGEHSVIMGYQAGMQGTNMSYSTLLGTFAGYSNTSQYQAFLGFQAGFNVDNGLGQTLVGSGAGYEGSGTQTSPYNSYLGFNAGRNVTDRRNTAVGSEALYGNATGATAALSVALGYRAAYGVGNNDGNVALGEGAGYNLGDGAYNTLIGARAGENVDDSNDEYQASTMAGALAGLDSQTGSKSNTFLGAAAGATNQKGDNNVVIGAFADFADWSVLSESDIEIIFTADSGTATGVTALGTNLGHTTLVGAYGTAAHNWTAGIGYGVNVSGYGAVAIGANATASDRESVALGYGASSHGDYIAVIGNTNTVAWHPHADGVTALGKTSRRFSNLYSQTLSVSADSGNAVALILAADEAVDDGDSWQLTVADGGDFSFGNDISGSQTNLVSMNSDGDFTVTGDVNVLSDANFKKNISQVKNAQQLINQLRPVSYKWRTDTHRDEREHLGLIAQEVEKILPEIVKTDTEQLKSVNYVSLLPLLAQSGGDLHSNQLKQRQLIDSLDARLSALEAALVSKQD